MAISDKQIRDVRDNRQQSHTRKQRQLAAAANRILAKGKYYDGTQLDSFGIDADMIGRNGLRPKWHGRA